MDAPLVSDDQRIGGRIGELAGSIAQRWIDARTLPLTPSIADAAAEVVRHIASATAGATTELIVADALIAALTEAGALGASQSIGELERQLHVVLEDEVTRSADAIDPRLVVAMGRRLHEAVQAFAEAVWAAFHGLAPIHRAPRHDELTRFAHWTSHELNNRVGAASLAALMLEEALADDDAARAMDLVLRLRGILGVLASVTNEVLVVASGRTAAEQPLVADALPRLLARLADELLPFAEHSRVALRMPASPPPVLVDASRLHLLIGILVHNAIKYADLSKAERWVVIEIHPLGDGAWEIQVHDNGAGIPREAQEAIFTAGYRRDPRTPGQGLGLAIARQIAVQLGTALSVTSAPGIGSTFSFTFGELRSEPAAAT